MSHVCDRSKRDLGISHLREYVDSVVPWERLGTTIIEELLCYNLLGGMVLPRGNDIELVMLTY